jgi:hypothetical protein
MKGTNVDGLRIDRRRKNQWRDGKKMSSMSLIKINLKYGEHENRAVNIRQPFHDIQPNGRKNIPLNRR